MNRWQRSVAALLLAASLPACKETAPPCSLSAPDPIPCPLDATDASGACWERLAPVGSGAFPDEWSPGKFPLGLLPIQAFNGELWMVGQKAAWSTGDAMVWSRHAKDDWGERIGLSFAFFKGELWMMGGLAYQARTFLNDVWRSADGSHWRSAGNAAWPARSGATIVPFKDKLWLFGGGVHATPDRSTDQFLNDVWSSEDGVSWTQVTASAPWPAMDYPRVLVFQDALLLLGGQGQAQVWRSPDGVQWTPLGSLPPWGARFDQGATLFDGRLWVYGGEPAPRQPRQAGVPINSFNDIWYSADGMTWLRQAQQGPWSPRSGMHTAVFQEKLWMFSGKHTGACDNWGGDLWTMRRR
jgi:hypothetical protein